MSAVDASAQPLYIINKASHFRDFSKPKHLFTLWIHLFSFLRGCRTRR